MTLVFAAGAAALSVACAVGHSLLSERTLLQPLFAEPRFGIFLARWARDITRGIFHMLSIVWVLLGLGVVASRIQGGNTLFDSVAVIIFTLSASINFAALRRPYAGNLLLMGAAILTICDMTF